MSDADERPMPALWSYLLRVYNQMEEAAEVEEQEGLDGGSGLVYTGHLTTLFQDMQIPNPYYTSVTQALKAMGCIIQLRRGGGTGLSKWALLERPTEQLFHTKATRKTRAVQHVGKLNILEQRIKDQTVQINQLRRQLEHLEARLERLEAQPLSKAA